MPPRFGTSGLRGLTADLTQDVIAQYTRAFLDVCPNNGTLYIGRDLRPSSPQIAGWIADAARHAGVDVNDCGAVPTPALWGHCAIMVTGSHIPADRNGLKFFTRAGEITKADEAAITAHLGGRATKNWVAGNLGGSLVQNTDLLARYAARYQGVFAPLTGRRIGVYQHSSVARDLLVDVLTSQGAQVIALGRSADFIPLDTEALAPTLRAQLAAWCVQHGLDAVVSTDADGDRPLVTDHLGAPIAGDVLGVITAQYLGADTICTPITSNSMVAQMPQFDLHLTQVGSPFVIAAMQAVLAKNPTARVAGFEANGGFLMGFDGAVPALLTRDAMLPILAVLTVGLTGEASLRTCVDALPSRFTAADRVADTDANKVLKLMDKLQDHAAAEAFLGTRITAINRLDGMRMTDDLGRIVHLRPSGNAPEFRCYTEAETVPIAQQMLANMMMKLAVELR